MRKTTDEWFKLLVPDDLSIHDSSASARAHAVRVRLVSLEGPLKLAEVLLVLVEHGFQDS